MSDLIAIPPLGRTILYYGLALGNAVAVPLIATGTIDAVYGALFANVSAVFGFTLAGGNVTKSPDSSQEPDVDGPIDEPEDDGSGAPLGVLRFG